MKVRWILLLPMSNSSVLDRFGIANDVSSPPDARLAHQFFPGIERSTTVEDIHIVRLDVFQDTAVELCCSADGKAPLVVKQSNPRESCCMKLPYPVNLKTHGSSAIGRRRGPWLRRPPSG